MHYLLFYDYVPDYETKRVPLRPLHLAYAKQAIARGELLLGGTFTDPVDGAVLFFSAPSAAVVESFAASDPYVLNGLVTRWRVRRWNTVMGPLAANPA